jgi:hypothetical protein
MNFQRVAVNDVGMPAHSSENTALLAKKNINAASDRPDRHSRSWRPQLLDRPNCIAGWDGLTGVSARRLPRTNCAGPCQWARRPRAALARALARNHVRQSSLEYAGLRGEGSTPVPLPPPYDIDIVAVLLVFGIKPPAELAHQTAQN